MLKRAGLLIMGISFLATGSCLAGGDPDIKAEEVSASTPNGAATSTSGTSSSGANSSGASAPAANTGSGHAGQRDDSFDVVENDELVIDVDSLADGDGLGSIQVQWQISEDGSNWMIIPGAILSSFTRVIQRLENICAYKYPMSMVRVMPK